MISTINLSIPTSAGPLAGVVHLPSVVPSPVVVCCHGLMSSKQSEKYVAIGQEFSRKGIAVVRFDFSDCGESKASLAETLLDSRTRDLNAVIDFVQQRPWADGRLGLLGSSLGGYLALLAAGLRQVQAIACWSTPFDLTKATPPSQDSDAIEEHFPPGFSLGIPENLTSLPPLPRVLVIHGQMDETVHWREAVQIYHQVGEPKRLMLMQSADHRFLDPAVRLLAIKFSLSWFREQGL